MAPARVVALRGPSSRRDVASGDGAEVAGAVSKVIQDSKILQPYLQIGLSSRSTDPMAKL